MKKVLSLPILMLLFFTLFGLSSVWAQTFSATAKGSDYYIYFNWTGARNACVWWPYSQYSFTLNGTTVGFVNYAGIGWDMPANSGNGTYHEAGPGQFLWYDVSFRHKGDYCDYGGTARIDGNTNPIRPPVSIVATVDSFDNKVIVKWGASNTDVPSDKYQYRVYRDNVLMTTVTSGTLTWTDNAPVPGKSYTYGVESYAANWNNASERKTVTGRAFGLNVRTESLASGVKIIWEKENSGAMNFQKFSIFRKDGDKEPDFLTTVTSASATSWTDVNNGGLPLPGYTYTYIVVPEDNAGTTYVSGSAPGSRLPDGSVSGYVKSPLGAGVQGVHVGIVRQNSVPQGESRTSYADTTDANGYYSVSGIYYYDDATFTITPALTNHGFRAASENRNLTLASHSITSVDFTDTSSFTIDCHVRQVFGGETLDVAGVEVQADDIARGYKTGANGRTAVTVADIGNHTFKPIRLKHTFTPTAITQYVSDNIADMVFFDTTMHWFSGTVSGPCGIYIGRAQLHVFDNSGKVDTLIESNQQGDFSVRLPAKQFSVRVNGFTPEGGLVTADSVLTYFADTTSIDLDTMDVVHAFIYRKKPTLTVSGFPKKGWTGIYNNIPVVAQAETLALEMDLKENFGTSSCLVDTGYAIIAHTLDGGNSVTDTVSLEGGHAVYKIVPGTPNIIAPHLYTLQIRGIAGNTEDQYASQVLVTGHRPREQTYTTVSPQIPFLILRDPPGDGSYSYMAENSTFNSAVRVSAKIDQSLNLWSQAKVGVEYEAGQFILTTFKAWGQIKQAVTIGSSTSSSTELNLTVTSSKKFSTSGPWDAGITGSDGDVFVGGAINMVYAITDVVDYDSATCAVVKDKKMIVAPDGFHTTFMYTDDHIRNVLIPQLEEMRDLYQTSNTDSATLYQSQRNVWQQVLDRNDSLKQHAVKIDNKSFSAGTPYESSIDINVGGTQTIEYSAFLEASLSGELGFEAGGSGMAGGVEATLRFELGASVSLGGSKQRSTGYALSDDDQGDYFSVDILDDPVYSTPVFKLVAGRSSCPWEAGTQPRDGVQLQADTTIRTGVRSTDAAVYTLQLGNTSQSNEAREYHLKFLQESNPYGAVITVGGSQVQAGVPIPYTIPAGGSVAATVTVRKGPSAFHYAGLKFELASPCDGNIAQNMTLDAIFCDTCNAAANHAPVITSLVLKNGLAGVPYADTLRATDADANQVMWYLLRGPEGMQVNTLTGIMSWNPSQSHLLVDTVVVRATDGMDSDTARFAIHLSGGSVALERVQENKLPMTLSLDAAPNPFNPLVHLSVAIPASVRKAMTLTVYNVSGKMLHSWTVQGAGYHSLKWLARDDHGKALPSGLYIARLTGGQKYLQKKLLLIK